MSDGTFANTASRANNESSPSLFKSLRLLPATDIFLFFYIAVLARQLFWNIGNYTIEWILTVLVSAVAIWILSFRRQPEAATHLSLSFWLIVALPLTCIFLLRVSIPDNAYDVLNYRLIYAERSLNGTQFIEGDFFPSLLSLNPAADTLTGLFRHALGYRLGTIINLFALLWTGAILHRMLASYIGNGFWRSVAVFAIVSTEQVLFQINGYMIDLLTVPLILEATRRIIGMNNDEPETIFDVAFVAFLLGLSCAFKLANLVFVVPLAGIYLFGLVFSGSRPLHSRLAQVVSFAVSFMLPLLPHALYIYSYTGSPVFPIYNQIFRSPYFPLFNFRDARFGAESFWEAFLYPVLTFVQPERVVELNYYSGRVALGAVVALICLILVRRDKHLFRLSLVVLAVGFLWSLSSGYIRYVLTLEIYGGVCAACLLSRLTTGDVKLSPVIRSVSIAVIGIVLGTQVFNAYGHVLSNRNVQWANRPVLFSEASGWRTEVPRLLRDYDLWKFQPADNQKLFEQVEVWIVSDIKTSGIQVLLKNNVPMINVSEPVFLSKDAYATDASRELFANTVSQVKTRRMYSLCYAAHLAAAKEAIKRAGLESGSTTPLRVPFYSDAVVFDMVLIEVLPTPLATSYTAVPPLMPNNWAVM